MRSVCLGAIMFSMVLSGCFGDDSDGSLNTPEDEDNLQTNRESSSPGGQNGESKEFYEHYNLTAQQLATPEGRKSLFQKNCVALTGYGFEILNGTVKAKWDAATPLANQMELTVTGDEWTVSGDQISPIELELENVQPSNDLIAISLQTGSTGLTVAQEFMLELQINYVGHMDADDTWDCTVTYS